MASQDYLDQILSDLEKDQLRAFYDNEAMREAVRKVILAGVYENGVMRKGTKPNPTVNFALSYASNADGTPQTNEEIGAQLRAAWEGIRFVESGFSNLARFKTENKGSNKPNPAR